MCGPVGFFSYFSTGRLLTIKNQGELVHKNELELKKAIVKAELVGKLFLVLEKLITTTGWVLGIYFIFQGLLGIVQSSPDSIKALSQIVGALQISNIMLTCTTVGGAVAWNHERRGKQRAIKKQAVMRRQLEREDPYRATSDLDENGHTPK